MSKNRNILLLGGGALALLLLADLSAAGKLGPINTTSSSSTSSGASLSVKQYVQKYLPYAIEASKITGVPALVILIFAAVESAFGKHAPGNNFFGVKAGKSWTGAIQLLKTFECGKTGDPKRDGISDKIISIHAPGTAGAHPACSKKGLYTYRVYGKFRAFPTPLEGFIGFGKFLRDNTRYKKAFEYKNDPLQFGIEVLKAGYATAPSYQEAYRKMYAGMKPLVG